MTPLQVAAAGALAGIAGAAILTAILLLVAALEPGRARQRPSVRAIPLTAGTVLTEAPGYVPDILQVSATFCQKLATGLFGTTLSHVAQRWAGAAWHLLYGALWGIAYALVVTSVPVPWSIAVPAFGLLVWAIGPGWLVPRMRLMLPPSIERADVVVGVLVGHLAFAAIVALVVALLTRSAVS